MLIRNGKIPRSILKSRPIVSGLIFLLPAILSIKYYSEIFQESYWQKISSIIVLGCCLVLFFLPKIRPFYVHLFFFLFTAVFLLKNIAPFNDQYLQYSLNKLFDLFSPFNQRHLYTDFWAYPENKLPDVPHLYWDYTYLPLATIPALLHHLLDCDPRLLFLGIHILVAWLLARFSKGDASEISSSLMLVSHFSMVAIPSIMLTNTLLVSLSLFLILFAYKYANTNFLLSTLLIIIAFLFLQTTWVFSPFFLIVFWNNNKLKSYLTGLAISSLILGYFFLQSPQEFIHSTFLTQISTSDVQLYQYFKNRSSNTFVSFSTLLELAFKIDPLSLLAFRLRTIFTGIILFSIFISTYRLRKNFTLKNAIINGIAVIFTIAFFKKFYWVNIHYYLGVGLMLCIRDFNYFEENKFLNKKKLSLIFSSLLICTIFSFIYLKNMAAKAFQFEAGENRLFSFTEMAGANLLNIKDSLVPMPKDHLTFHRNSGWANSILGSSYFVLTPPGEYLISICNQQDICQTKTIIIDLKKSYALRMQFGIKLQKNNQIDISLIMNASNDPSLTIFVVENAKTFSVKKVC